MIHIKKYVTRINAFSFWGLVSISVIMLGLLMLTLWAGQSQSLPTGPIVIIGFLAITLGCSAINRRKQRITIDDCGVLYYESRKNQEHFEWGDIHRLFVFRIGTAPRFLVLSKDPYMTPDRAYAIGNKFKDEHCNTLLLQYTAKLSNSLQEALDKGYLQCALESYQ